MSETLEQRRRRAFAQVQSNSMPDSAGSAMLEQELEPYLCGALSVDEMAAVLRTQYANLDTEVSTGHFTRED